MIGTHANEHVCQVRRWAQLTQVMVAAELEDEAHRFKTTAKDLKQQQWWKNTKVPLH